MGHIEADEAGSWAVREKPANEDTTHADLRSLSNIAPITPAKNIPNCKSQWMPLTRRGKFACRPRGWFTCLEMVHELDVE